MDTSCRHTAGGLHTVGLLCACDLSDREQENSDVGKIVGQQLEDANNQTTLSGALAWGNNTLLHYRYALSHVEVRGQGSRWNGS